MTENRTQTERVPAAPAALTATTTSAGLRAAAAGKRRCPKPVRLVSAETELAEYGPLLNAIQSAVGDVPVLLALAREVGSKWPKPGDGQTGLLWELLASVASVDVAAGRVFEPHLDAQAILAQAGIHPAERAGVWGVFAAEGPGARLQAKSDGDDVLLSGAKPWCSLAPLLDRAVITAHAETGGRAAYAVDLRHPGVSCEEPAWVARGLREIPSGTVHFSQVPAVPLGGDGWYFSRPGFAWGGMGVAACWLGGAVAVAREYKVSLSAAAGTGREPDQIALAALGETDRILTSTVQYLARTAQLIDGGALSDDGGQPGGDGTPGAGTSAWSEALRARGTVAAAVERVLSLVSQNRGPAPLAFDEPYAKRMADLALYVRQHHAMRDDAQLGKLTLGGQHLW
ncbi:hypothetical protein ABIB45_002113 [Arthrobacter sp. UYCo732]